MKLKTKERIQKYILHLGLSFIVPLLFTIIRIAISGDREFGMAYGIFSSLILLNIFYAFYFLKSKWWINLVSGLFVTIVSCGVVYVFLSEKIKPRFDFYGIYTALFSYGTISIFAWEVCYRKLLSKNNRNDH